MSGGSLDYVYSRVASAAAEISSRATTTQQRAFAAHLVKVSKALHDLEWLYSFDYGPGDEVEAIDACLAPGLVLDQAIAEAKQAAEVLRVELEKSCKGSLP